MCKRSGFRQGVTYIGRSDECEVTIEDPLVSRRHARRVSEGDGATSKTRGGRSGADRLADYHFLPSPAGPEGPPLAPLALAAQRICIGTGHPRLFPPAAVTDRLVALRLRYADVAVPVEGLLAHCRSMDDGSQPPSEDGEAMARLDRGNRGSRRTV